MLPFLGSRVRDWFTFEYYLLDVSRYGLQIGVLPALDGTKKILKLKKGDTVALHLALRSDDGVFHRGKIMWTDQDKSKDLLICGLRLEAEPPGPAKIITPLASYAVSLSLETSDIFLETTTFDSADILFLSLIETSVKIKAHIRDAIDNVLPFLKKTGSSIEDSLVFLQRIKDTVNNDSDRLQACSHMIRNVPAAAREGQPAIQLDDLRVLMGSDVYSVLIQRVVPNAKKRPLLGQIMEFERQLFVNYNTISLLWLGYLAYMYQNLDTPA